MQRKKEHHVMQLFIRLEAGARNEDMNFCVNMVKCTVCMSVYDYICCHYMRGGYRVLLEYETSHYTLFVQTFF